MTGVGVPRTIFLRTDVICVKCFGSYVLAGVGGILKIFSLLTNRCLKEVEVFEGHKIYDWIITAHWLSNGDQIALVTAHNVAYLWPWESDPNSFLKRATCSEKCILYSAEICGDDWKNCVVFAGTVFREVVVWLPGGSGHEDQPVLHRLVGHNGVIFSLTWDRHSNSLCSTSDDRSIHLWNISFSNQSDWKTSEVSCSYVFYGHSARVWRSIILEDVIVSVGEDCQICMWSMKGKLLQTLERSTSGCQWSLDYSDKYQLLVTGAGDGSVQLIPFSLPFRTPSVLPISFSDLINRNTFLFARKIKMLASGCIVTVTEEGTLLSGFPDEPASWKIECKDERFSNYCVISVSPSRRKFSLASLKGHVAVYDGTTSGSISKVLEKKVETSKIWSLLWLSNKEVLVSGDEGRMGVWKISQNQGVDLTCIGRFSLPRARERWPTCATLVIKDSEKFILCGDRCGSLHLYKIQNFLQDEGEYKVPDHSLPKLHGRLGVTSVQQLKNKIVSTGRDSTVRSLRVNVSSGQLLVISTDKMPMEWVASVLCPSQSSNHFLIAGFREINMIIWSTEERREIINVDCGGGHRSWDCMMSEKEKLEFAFVREKQIYYASWRLEALMKPTILNGVSPRELNCVSLVDCCPSVLMFGGEDGSLYLSKFSSEFSRLEEKIILTTHISSIRCICSHKSLFFSAGGRAQLKAWQIEVDSTGQITCIEEATHMLKGERNPRLPPSIDPEMRYMSLCCIPREEDNSDSVQLVAGYSDGALRWLTYDSVRKAIQVIGESMFHGKCVLKLLPVHLPEGKVVLISTATDGRIALWLMSPEMFETVDAVRDPFWSNRAHQSGINCVHATLLPATIGTTLVVASGGDDNAIAVTVLHLNQDEVCVVAEWSCSSAHAAQVTGIWLVGRWLVSTSIDQRLTVWQWTLCEGDKAQLRCDFIHQTICSVPDIQDMLVWQRSDDLHVCVVGKGVQILSIPLEK